MPTITLISRRDYLVLLVILLLASWMRLGRAGVVEYFHDDAMLSTLALEMVDGGNFPVTGILSSTGIPNPPTSVYTMAIPFSLSSDPNVAIHFVMLLNIVGVGLLWLIAHRYFGRHIGTVAGVLYAVNPWAVLFSRKIWAQDFHTPFILLGILLLFYGFYEARDSRKSRLVAQAFAVPILLYAFQIHFASWALAPIILVALWMGRQQIDWRALGLSAVLSVLVLMPYLIGLTQTLDNDPTRISDAAGRSTATDGIELTVQPIISTLYLSSGYGLETWIAPDQQTDLAAGYPTLVWLGLGMTVMMFVGTWGLWLQCRMLAVFVLMWAFLPQLVLIPDWTPVYAHYFIPSIPAMLLMAGVGVTVLMRYNRALLGLSFGLVGMVSGLQMMTWHAVLDYVEQYHIPYPGFTTPITDLNMIRDYLQDSDDVLVISQGMAWNLHHEVGVWDTLLWDNVACVRTMVGDGYAVLPDHAFSVLIAPDAPDNPANNLYETSDPIYFETRIGDKGYMLYEWDVAPNWETASMASVAPIQFDNGVLLTGYALQDGIVYLDWVLPPQNKGADYQYSVQMFDADGNRVAQLDKTFWHGRHWCANDRLLTWGDLDTTSDVSSMQVSMYRLGTGKQIGQYFNANVLDALGNPMGQYADIQLIE